MYCIILKVEKVKTQNYIITTTKIYIRLNFREPLKDKFPMVNKQIRMLKKLNNYCPRHFNKAFV